MPELEAHLERQGDAFADFFWHRLRWRAVAEFLPRGVPFSIADVGAGAGHFGTFLAREFPLANYYFIEPLSSLEERLTVRYGAERNLRATRHLSGMHFITLLDVVEHQEDDAAFLDKLVASIDEGATLILTAPALMRLWSQWDVALGHYRRYDRQSMIKLLSALPVDIEEVSYLFPELVIPGLWRARQSRRRPERPVAQRASFPELPNSVNRLLYRLGSPAVDWRRRMPTGSSILAVARIATPRSVDATDSTT